MVSVKEMYNAYGHKVKIICDDGQEIIGNCTGLTNAADSEPEEDSIFIENGNINGGLLTEIYQHEIESIEILD